MPASRHQGLEITFAVPLFETLSGVSPGGAIFFREFIKQHDSIKNSIVLREDYDVFQNLTDQHLLFKGAAPDAVEFHIRSDLVHQIKDIGSDKIVFPK